MNFDLDENDIWNLLNGIKPDITDCIELEKSKIMLFCGNQHNEDWKWNKEWFDNLPQKGEEKSKKLFIIYEMYKPKK